MPPVDTAPDLAQLLVLTLDVRRAVGPNETMPANGTPGEVLVVALLGRASLAPEARQERGVGGSADGRGVR